MAIYNNKVIQTGLFRGKAKQPLRNVLIFAPTIVWVEQGAKQLFWQEQKLNYDKQSLLLTSSNSYLTFINLPHQQYFVSRSITFFISPPEELLQASLYNSVTSKPYITMNSALSFCFNALYDMDKAKLSIEAQKQIVFALYEELHAIKALHLLFPSKDQSLSERIARYISVNPSENHKISTISAHFLMSPATFKRKLAAENTHFRQILTDVRMNFSLELLQKGYSVQEASLACGYDSSSRFSHRFKQRFGLTPRDYVLTLN